MNILSIDARRDGDSSTWNAWYKCGTIDKATFEALEAKGTRAILRYLRDEAGLLSDASKGRVSVEDDGYNVVIVDRNTREPLFAIEYGPHYN